MNPSYPHHPPQGPETAPPAPGHVPGGQGCSSQATGAQNYHDQNVPAQSDRPNYHLNPGGWDYSRTAMSDPAVSGGEFRTWFDFSNSCYLKGLLIGAGATLLLTNPAVQKALVRGTVKVWSLVQGGVEEVKEQFRDVKAEMSQEE